LTTVSPSMGADSFSVEKAESFGTGRVPGPGTFFCTGCGSQLSLQESDRLPDCPRCGGSSFRRDSIFEPMQEHGSNTAEFAATSSAEASDWLADARQMLSAGGIYLVCQDDEGEIQAFPIDQGWTRIGRSANADIRLDDPSVSRRHALIVLEGRSLRILDDRSLNGIFLNGEVVEWGRLHDGDELTIGRYHLYTLQG
jgi:predicted  nucleic acid-binding Zn-ribbon protein